MLVIFSRLHGIFIGACARLISIRGRRLGLWWARLFGRTGKGLDARRFERLDPVRFERWDADHR